MTKEDFNRAYSTAESVTEKALLFVIGTPVTFLIVLAWSVACFALGAYLL